MTEIDASCSRSTQTNESYGGTISNDQENRRGFATIANMKGRKRKNKLVMKVVRQIMRQMMADVCVVADVFWFCLPLLSFVGRSPITRGDKRVQDDV